MRILMLTQSYPPAIGGTERHVHDLSVELVTRGHDVAVVTLLQEGAPDFECDQGVRIYRVLSSLQRLPAYLIDKGQPHAPPFPDPEVMQALWHIIVYERPDIVHAHNWMVHSFTPLKKWSKSKLIVSLHDCSRVCAKQAFVHHGSLCTGPAPMKCLECAIDHYRIAKGVSISLGGWMWKQVSRQAIDMFLPVSEAVAHVSQLVELGLPYHMIPNFLPDDWNMSATHSDLLLPT